MFDNFLFRCSALGNIVSKSGKLTDHNKTYLQECFIGEVEGVRKEAYGKALDKGTLCEEDGITMLQHIYPNQLLVKNKVRKENGYIKGEADVYKNKIIHDIKNAYDRFTFGKASLTWEYQWQVKGYCWLWGTDKGMLFYCLNNLPEGMLIAEERSLFYKNSGKYLTMESPEYIEDVKKLRAAHNYDNMPIWERFKTWDIKFTSEDEETMKAAVEAGRNHMNLLWQERQEQITKNKKLMGLLEPVI